MRKNSFPMLFSHGNSKYEKKIIFIKLQSQENRKWPALGFQDYHGEFPGPNVEGGNRIVVRKAELYVES